MLKPTTLLAALLVLPACLLEDELAIEEDTFALTGENGLSMNGLSMNGLSMNGLSMNGLSMNSLEFAALMETDQGRDILHYVVKCALVDGDYLIGESRDGNYIFPGLFGLAPSWKYSALSDAQARDVTACLLAHVNHYGVSVSISVRYDGVEDVSEEEADRYSFHEGAFFGNLFLEKPSMYGCWADDAPEFGNGPPERKFGDRLLRRCTDPESNGETTCGMLAAGKCDDVCTDENGGSFKSCTVAGETYPTTINVFLLEADDPGSVWENYYEAFFY